jgi:uncharacterized protein (TIGR00251 family)
MMDIGLDIRETTEGLLVRLRVVPRAKRCEVSGAHNGALKVKVTAPPVDDAANRTIIDFFSSLLHIPKSRLTVLKGLKSKDKVMQIKDLSINDFRAKMAANLPSNRQIR